MGITLTCYDPTTGQMKTFEANTVDGGGSGFGTPMVPNFGAQGINLSMRDVQRTIQEGRAAGIKPFNLYNSASPWDSAQ